jgi:hypothetical protein
MRNLFTRLSAVGVSLIDYLARMVTALRIIIAAFIVGLGIGGFLLGPAALALVIPQNFAPRQFPTQQVHYARFSVNFNSCVYVTLTCSVKIGAIPYNSYILRVNNQVTTAWNAGTSAAIALGTASGGGQLVASAVTGPGTGGGAASTVVAANVGIAATGNGITPTGGDGGFDVWATILIVGALPTTGQTNFVLEYIAPNDGQCVYVPIGATSPGC